MEVLMHELLGALAIGLVACLTCIGAVVVAAKIEEWLYWRR